MFNHPRNTNYNPNDNQDWMSPTFRAIGWTIIAHPACASLSFGFAYVALAYGVPLRMIAITVAVFCVVEVVALQAKPNHVLARWAEAIRFRRRWFTVWTSMVNARHDHTVQRAGLIPILGLVPRIKGRSASWTIRPAAGQTLAVTAEFADLIAAHSPAVDEIAIGYRKRTSSHGTLTAIFDDNLATPKNARWTTPPTTRHDNRQGDIHVDLSPQPKPTQTDHPSR